MAGDTYNVSGTVTGANIGRNNRITTGGSIQATAPAVARIAETRRQAQEMAGEPGQAEFLDHLDGLEQDVSASCVEPGKVERRLQRLAELAASLGLVEGVVKIAEAVKGFVS